MLCVRMVALLALVLALVHWRWPMRMLQTNPFSEADAHC
jgi:hypothetical protein